MTLLHLGMIVIDMKNGTLVYYYLIDNSVDDYEDNHHNVYQDSNIDKDNF